MDEDYRVLRERRGMQLHDISFKGQMVKLIYQEYERAFHTNLHVHGRTRIARFLTHHQKERIARTLEAVKNREEPGEDCRALFNYVQTLEKQTKLRKKLGKFSWKNLVNPTLHYLFSGGPRDEANDVLLRDLEVEIQLPRDATFNGLEEEPCRFLKYFYKLQCWAEKTEGASTFCLVPIFKHGRHHIRIDTDALCELLRSIKIPNVPPSDEFRPKKGEYWRRFFTNKYVSWQEDGARDRWFDFSITTDGVAVSLSMQRRKNIVSPEESSTDIPEDGDIVIGSDPGLRLTYGAVVNVYKTNPEETIAKEQNIKKLKISSNEWRNNSGEFRRKRKLDKWTRRVEEISRTTLSPNHPSERLQYTVHRLKLKKKNKQFTGNEESQGSNSKNIWKPSLKRTNWQSRSYQSNHRHHRHRHPTTKENPLNQTTTTRTARARGSGKPGSFWEVRKSRQTVP